MEDQTRPPSASSEPEQVWETPSEEDSSPPHSGGVVSDPSETETVPTDEPVEHINHESGYPSEPLPAEGGGGQGPPVPSPGGGGDGEEPEEEGMAKMSFLEHLEELRRRIINSLLAVAVGFGVCFWFAQAIFDSLAKPVTDVLRKLNMPDKLYYTHPADAFNVYLQIALVAGLFLASPVVLYQLWAFISPGLYTRERRYAAPFVFVCSGLFIAGGLFGYLVAFPFALEFLLSMGGPHMTPWLTAKEYLDLFTTIILGLGIIFEMPVLILFLALLRVVTPGFLMRNFRYAVLIIAIIAAIVTPTTDITNLILFTVPMLALYLLGAGMAWLVTRRRERDA